MNYAPVLITISHDYLLVYVVCGTAWIITRGCLSELAPKHVEKGKIARQQVRVKAREERERDTERDRQKKREREKEREPRKKERSEEEKGTEPRPKLSRLLRLTSVPEIDGASVLGVLFVGFEAFYRQVWAIVGNWWDLVSTLPRAYWRRQGYDNSGKDEGGGASNQCGLETYQL